MNNMNYPGSLQAAEGEVVTKLVYNNETGEIIHVHSVMVTPEAETPSDAAVEAEARSLACDISGTPERNAEVLTVNLDELDRGATYAVDLTTRRLVARVF